MCGFGCGALPLNDDKTTNTGSIAPIKAVFKQPPKNLIIVFVKFLAFIISSKRFDVIIISYLLALCQRQDVANMRHLKPRTPVNKGVFVVWVCLKDEKAIRIYDGIKKDTVGVLFVLAERDVRKLNLSVLI